ncbi:GntR family transcriptional regulator [Draconibacterium halophilum]|uniref:GntR family transcriptional regulator n=1 Tax=Draconibacterium halophilum TaxID=2706887 RepID=A0A6C0REN2_9BACT|nr:GntR family transcriptional regulator [Draconibacterium halophilum]QIA08332.1 GntR family transcriptional regulator [Draconibacterium halophilum]
MKKTKPKYLNVQIHLKQQIQQGTYNPGDFIPSENQLCKQFSITRTTARKALDELIKEGFIERIHGKGSRVKERRHTLGLLNVKGFSEAVGEGVNTKFLQHPIKALWSDEIILPVSETDRNASCFYFERLRFVGKTPVMLEKNWFPNTKLPQFTATDFVDGSFFKTLSQRYLIEIVGSTQEIRSEFASEKHAKIFGIESTSPLLHISIKFLTSNPKLTIYSELYCDTSAYPVGNSYYL